MSQITNILNAALPYIVLIAVGIVAIYSYARQHNPAVADKIKWLYDVAQYIVTQQATHDDATGAEKKAAATAALLAQAKQSKTKITSETAKGMIEKAYQDTQKDNDPTGIDDIQGFAEDEDDDNQLDAKKICDVIDHSLSNMANTPTDSVEADGTDSNDDTTK